MHSLLFIIPSTDCNCPKGKTRSDGKLAVDAICDEVGECMCPTIADADQVTLTDGGCVVGGMLLLTDDVHVSKLPAVEVIYYFTNDNQKVTGYRSV